MTNRKAAFLCLVIGLAIVFVSQSCGPTLADIGGVRDDEGSP